MSNPQPTLDDIWVVFETLINIAHANSNNVIDVLQFKDSVDKTAVQTLNYEVWHSRWKLAAVRMAKNIMPILGEMKLGEFEMPNDIPTITLNDTAFDLYNESLQDMQLFAAYMRGEITDKTQASPKHTDEAPAEGDNHDADKAIASNPVATGEKNSTPEEISDTSDNPFENIEETDENPKFQTDANVSNNTSIEEQSVSTSSNDDFFAAKSGGGRTSPFNQTSDTDSQTMSDASSTEASPDNEQDNPHNQTFTNDAQTNPDVSQAETISGGDDFFAAKSGGGRASPFNQTSGNSGETKQRRKRKVNRDLMPDPTADNDETETASKTDASTPEQTTNSDDTTTDDSYSGHFGGRQQKKTSNEGNTGRSRQGQRNEQRGRKTSNTSSRSQRQTFGESVSGDDASPTNNTSPSGSRRRRIASQQSETPLQSAVPTNDNTQVTDQNPRRTLNNPPSIATPSTSSGGRRRPRTRQQGPRAKPSEPTRESNTKPNVVDVVIVPLPNGTEKSFSKSVLERLILEHGTLTDVITWYMEQQNKEG